MKKLFIITLILTIIISINNVNGAILDNYIGGWKLDTDTLFGSTGQKDNLNISNATLLNGSQMVFITNGSCKIGQCYRFTAAGTTVANRIRIDNTLQLQKIADTDAYTISIWVYPEVNTTNYQGIIGRPQTTSWTDPYHNIVIGMNEGTPNNIYSRTSSAPSNMTDLTVEINWTPRWYHVVVTYNKSTNTTFYIDGVKIGSITANNREIYNSTTHWSIGAYRWDGTNFGSSFAGYEDDVNMWNRDLNITEIQSIYNNNLTYPFTITTPPLILSYNVTNIQTPSDINDTVTYITINTTITNLTESNITTNSYTELYYKLNTGLNSGCSIFYQSNCYKNSTDYSVTNMTKITNTSYYKFISDTELLPAYYPYDYSYINDNVGSNYTNYLNNNIRFNIFNFSTLLNYTYLSIEMDAINKSSSTASMLIYYCNSSYSTGNPLTNNNCELISTYLPQLWNHTHNFSSHGVVKFQVRNITKTQNSSVIFVSPNILVANGWNFRYVTNTSYDNKSFCIGNVNSWNCNDNKIFDIHLHQYLPSDYFQYYTKFYDGSGNSNVSLTVTDFYNITQSPPTIPQLYTPECNSTNYTYGGSEQINFSWSTSSDVNNDAIHYLLYLYNPLLVPTLIYNGSSVNVLYNVSSLSSDYYYTQIVSCDAYGCSYDDIDCSFNICTNSWTQTIQPCINSVQLITYTDSNNCPSQYNVPVTNGTYGACTVAPTEIKTVYNDDMLVLIILGFFLILAIVLAITVHEAFFGLSALIVALMFTTFLYYDYPDILNYFAVFMIIVLSGMWILVARKR